MRSLIICPEDQVSASLQVTLSTIRCMEVSRVLNSYPDVAELTRWLRVHAPEVVFLSFEDLDSARNVVKEIEKHAPGVQIVGVHGNFDARILRETMRYGVREFLAHPFERETVVESISHIEALLERNPVQYETTSEVFSFLPAKAGSGTSTLALNVSACLAKHARVLLSDFDLNSGMIRFSLNLPNHHSVVEAVEHASHMDDKLWSQLVVSRGSLDILHAGSVNPHLRIEPEQIRQLTGYMRRTYPVLCFDLSGNLERYSLEILQESKRVFLVCTAEYAALHLAREKAQFLRKYELGSRIQVVLNRVTKRSLLTSSQVEEVLGMPVTITFANDYHSVTQAMASGKPIDASCELGKQIARFSESLLGSGGSSQPEPAARRRFLDLFSSPGSPAAAKS